MFESGEPLERGASAHELLREKDFAEMTPEEFERATAHGCDRAHAAAADITTLVARSTRRPARSAAHVPSFVRTGGEPIEQPWKARKTVPRKLVVLCDVSGSMDAYARALLFYLHAIVGTGQGVEAFAFGTRLMRDAGPRDARSRSGARSRDRDRRRLGKRHAHRKLAGRVQHRLRPPRSPRGAVVVIVSDGWERDDPDLIEREMAKPARAAYAVVWVNLLKGNPEYQPLAGGMRAAPPFVDQFSRPYPRSLEELGSRARRHRRSTQREEILPEVERWRQEGEKIVVDRRRHAAVGAAADRREPGDLPSREDVRLRVRRLRRERRFRERPGGVRDGRAEDALVRHRRRRRLERRAPWRRDRRRRAVESEPPTRLAELVSRGARIPSPRWRGTAWERRSSSSSPASAWEMA